MRAETNAGLTDVSDRKRITKQDLVDGVLEWFLKQESLLQSIIAGQIEPVDHADVAKLLLRRLGGEHVSFGELIGHDQPPGSQAPSSEKQKGSSSSPKSR